MSYDLSAPSGQVRLLIADTSEDDPIFTDAEISAFLSMESNNIPMAAYRAFGAIIRDRTRLAKKILREGYDSESHAIESMLAAQRELKDMSMDQGGLQSGSFVITDEFLEYWRPTWRDYNTIVP